MIIGPSLIVRVEGCKHPQRLDTIRSGNNFGGIFWSDGKMDARMMPDMLALMKAPSEGILYWREDATVVAEIEPGGNIPGDCEQSICPNAEDYEGAIAGGLATSEEREKYLRKRWLWSANDRIRRNPERRSPNFWSEPLVANIECLLRAISIKDDGHRLFAAELNRNLGRFDEALTLLSFSFKEQNEPAAEKMRAWIETAERFVQVLHGGTGSKRLKQAWQPTSPKRFWQFWRT
jgi:hypothetical protein